MSAFPPDSQVGPSPSSVRTEQLRTYDPCDLVCLLPDITPNMLRCQECARRAYSPLVEQVGQAGLRRGGSASQRIASIRSASSFALSSESPLLRPRSLTARLLTLLSTAPITLPTPNAGAARVGRRRAHRRTTSSSATARESEREEALCLSAEKIGELLGNTDVESVQTVGDLLREHLSLNGSASHRARYAIAHNGQRAVSFFEPARDHLSSDLRFITTTDAEARDAVWRTAAWAVGAALRDVRGTSCKLAGSPTLISEHSGGNGFTLSWIDDMADSQTSEGPSEKQDASRAAATYVKGLQPARVLSAQELLQLAKRASKMSGKGELLRVNLSEARQLLWDNPLKLEELAARGAQEGQVDLLRFGSHLDLAPMPGQALLEELRRGSLSIELSDCDTATWVPATAGASVERSDVQTLVRIRGVAFLSKEELVAHKETMRAALEADHRAIGSSQDLFIIHDASPGTPFVLPNGTRLVRKVERVIRDLYAVWGYDEIITPQLMRKSLWQRSGHWDNYRADMFGVKGFVDVDNSTSGALEESKVPITSSEQPVDRACCAAHQDGNVASSASDSREFGLKPMNCPGHCLVFASKERSYRDLPIRNESSGSLSGLTRVRRFHQDDAHVFCSLEQVAEEITSMLAMLSSAYTTFGFQGNFELVLSTRPSSYIGSIDEWNRAERALEDALSASGHKWNLNEADGAFYGPKIDVRLVDAAGRRHQTATIQLDFQLPRRFELKYTDPNAPDGTGQSTPVMIHRAILGSVERFLAILIEQTRGHWPFWINPRQAIVLPVKPDDPTHLAYAEQVKREVSLGHAHCGALLRSADPKTKHLPARPAHVFHVELDASNARFPKRVAKARAARANFVLTIGDREVSSNTVKVTAYGPGVITPVSEQQEDGAYAKLSDAEQLQAMLGQLEAGNRPTIRSDMGDWTTRNLRRLFEALDSYHC